MIPLSLLWEDHDLELLQMTEEQNTISLSARISRPTAICPGCQNPSKRVHSRYVRFPADLPLVGKRLVLRLTVRKFHCDNDECQRRIFCERLPTLVAAYARTTRRLHQAHLSIALAAGGEGGARLANRLGMPTSGDTLLRRVHAAPLPETPTPQVIGVDDWAFRRGRTSGTIVCDLERRCPVDLLPDRTSESLSAWLKDHPDVSIISRDRASDYAQGAKQGAPQATQVADRWHLLKNLRDALKRLADRFHGPVRNAAEIAAASRSLPLDPASPIKTENPPEDSESGQALETPESPAAQNKWRLLYQQVIELRQQQVSQREIARRTGLDRGTVGRYLKAGTFPERTPGWSRGPKSSLANEHLSHLKRRWDEGCRNASQLFQEVQSQGFRGSYYAVRRALAKWREPGSSARSSPKNVPAFKVPSASNVAWLLFKREKDLEGTEQRFVQELKTQCPSIKQGAELGQEFIAMIRERQIENWPTWFERATAPDVPQDIRNFALSLKSDEAAVKAALSLEWSNGQVEGQINRLKTLKRQMYGRGSLELLRKRILLAA